jgi:hypothetical protein
MRVRLGGPVVIGFKAFRSPRIDVVDFRLFKRGTPRDAQMAACAGDAAVVLKPTPQIMPGGLLMRIAGKRSNRATHGVWPVSVWDGRAGAGIPPWAFWAVLGQLSGPESMPQVDQPPPHSVTGLW